MVENLIFFILRRSVVTIPLSLIVRFPKNRLYIEKLKCGNYNSLEAIIYEVEFIIHVHSLQYLIFFKLMENILENEAHQLVVLERKLSFYFQKLIFIIGNLEYIIIKNYFQA